MNSFGSHLRLLRTDTGLSMRDVSKKLDMHFTWVSKVENDKEIPGWDTLKKLLKLYKQTADHEIQFWAREHLLKTKKEQFTLATL